MIFKLAKLPDVVESIDGRELNEKFLAGADSDLNWSKVFMFGNPNLCISKLKTDCMYGYTQEIVIESLSLDLWVLELFLRRRKTVLSAKYRGIYRPGVNVTLEFRRLRRVFLWTGGVNLRGSNQRIFNWPAT